MANVHTTSIPEIDTVRQVLAAIALVLCIGAGHAAPPFVVGDESIAVGERRSFFLSVPAGEGDECTTIPVTVIRGSAPGPVLALIAGTHGYEYPPITAHRTSARRSTSTRCGNRADGACCECPRLPRPDHLRFAGRKELNRVYPGDLAGTLSDRPRRSSRLRSSNGLTT